MHDHVTRTSLSRDPSIQLLRTHHDDGANRIRPYIYSSNVITRPYPPSAVHRTRFLTGSRTRLRAAAYTRTPDGCHVRFLSGRRTSTTLYRVAGTRLPVDRRTLLPADRRTRPQSDRRTRSQPTAGSRPASRPDVQHARRPAAEPVKLILPSSSTIKSNFPPRYRCAECPGWYGLRFAAAAFLSSVVSMSLGLSVSPFVRSARHQLASVRPFDRPSVVRTSIRSPPFVC